MNDFIKKELRGYIERETTSFYNEIGRYIVVKDVFLLELEEYIDELEEELKKPRRNGRLIFGDDIEEINPT